jgi:hypothetical protein
MPALGHPITASESDQPTLKKMEGAFNNGVPKLVGPNNEYYAYQYKGSTCDGRSRYLSC